ncbi:MAG TPA: Ig-like domain-containing protein [Candidatus Koribacter sp.]|jgi:hypothetical protein
MIRPFRHLPFLLAFTLVSTISGLAQATCKLSTTNRTVTICTPAKNATVSTTFHVNAGTTDTLGIQYIELYVANVRYVIQHTNYLDATVTVPAGSNQNLTVQAHDTGGVTFKASIPVNISASATYSISPTSPTVTEGGTQQFTASTASTWSATCGTITSGGLFTAPYSQPSCSVKGTASNGSGSASTNVKISSPITITPSSATTTVNATQQFSANQAVNWSASCGTINSSGLFTAPATAGSCTITATASSGNPYTARATDTVTSSAPAAINYTTWKYDNSRDGLNPNETILTPTNVKSSFGTLFTVKVDGKIWTQPLYMNGLTIGSARHNVVYVATDHDDLYALDGDSGATLWHKSLLPTGESPANSTAIHSDVQPLVGVVGTPVIDPASSTIYLIAQSGDANGNYFHRLHALSLTSGAEKSGSPVLLSASGWDSAQHLQRPGLLLASGNVYAAFGSNDDQPPYHGWVFAFDAGTLQQIDVWNNTPSAEGGGIWMGGGGIAADKFGNLLLSTGNGDWDGTAMFGQSIVELSPTLGILDYFTPIDHVNESKGDKDLGSGGLLLLPTNGGPYPHEAVNCSKLNVIYVLNRDHLGELGSSSDNVVQQVTGQIGGASGTQNNDKCFTTPAYWNNNLYFVGNNDGVKQFTWSPSTGLISTTPTHKDTYTFAFPGGQPVVSSNGNSNPIVWVLDWSKSTLRAYDGTNVSNVLYTSPALPTGGGVKFDPPTVVNGHVYVALGTELTALGLKSTSSCAAPSSPGAKICTPVAGGSYSSPVTITASGRPNSGATSTRMELWADGKKLGNFYATQISTTATLATGSHALTAVEVDSTGAVLKSPIINFTVK